MVSNRAPGPGMVVPENLAPSTASTHEDEIPEDKAPIDSKEDGGTGDPEDIPNLAGGSTYIIDWEGPDDPENPRNWTFGKKWVVTTMVSAYVFMSPVSSSMMAPASARIAAHLGVTGSTLIALQTSIFLGGYAAGPLVLGPLSEAFGRQRILQFANFWYLAWNLGCAFVRDERELLLFRFLSGFGGNGLITIGGGVLGDVWPPAQRGQAVAVYTLAPLLGPVVGPMCGAWIAERGDWRWVFWAPTIVAVVVQLVGLYFLEETYPPVILARKARRIRRGLVDLERSDQYTTVRTIFDGADREWRNFVINALVRPFVLFVREPIIQLLGCYMAFMYGTLYLFLTTIPLIFRGVYNEPLGIAGLNYIAIGIGLTGASQISARLLDVMYMRLMKKNGGVGKPEYRLLFMFPGTVLLPTGLLITGWTARPDIHWIVPDLAIVLVGAGMVLNFQAIQMYVIDAFTLHCASALAAVMFFRSVAACVFPLFAPAMYNALHYGRGDTILACAAIAIGGPSSLLFLLYGERVRNASRYARHS
ncbi:MFS general substrate transporter [Ganoderma sinense ZZ0214-1]|uniref:MFS general substrate transporter n=1 Tax=Ganoderma sinense ZZ0214-1 TaxID=1077348 RepID=A0A2G8SR26_9APHY|nr:MFS general substrate transporter [Ganoderma sinense ZZ0214-1]